MKLHFYAVNVLKMINLLIKDDLFTFSLRTQLCLPDEFFPVPFYIEEFSEQITVFEPRNSQPCH